MKTTKTGQLDIGHWTLRWFFNFKPNISTIMQNRILKAVFLLAMLFAGMMNATMCWSQNMAVMDQLKILLPELGDM